MGDEVTEKVFLVHSEIDLEVLRAIEGVEDVQELTSSAALVLTSLSRSRLYHEVKWAAPDETPVVVAELRAQPKATRVAPGAVSWMRDHLPQG